MQIDELPTNDEWNDYDWHQVFPPNEGDDSYGGEDYSGTFAAGPNGQRIDDVTAERIKRIIHWNARSPEGYGSVDFYAVVELTDGQFASCEAWADTTGWGCRADASWRVGPTSESVMAELSEVNRLWIQGQRPEDY